MENRSGCSMCTEKREKEVKEQKHNLSTKETDITGNCSPRSIPIKFDKVKIQDSGKSRKFDTGSVRDDRTGKGRFDLLSPFVARRDAIHIENGAKKYNERNWEKGQPLMSFLDSAIRHLEDYKADLLLGQPNAEDHLAASRWNIAAFIHTEEMIYRGLLPVELDDRPGPQPKQVGKTYKKDIDFY